MGPIERQLRHGAVWSARDDMSPLEGLQRAAAEADAETLQLWGKESVALLAANDVALRTRAVAALDYLPFAALDVVYALRARPWLYEGVEAQGHPLFPSMLADALYARLARDCHPDALPTLRERLPAQPSLAVLLARKEGPWLVDNAGLVERRVLGGVLRGLPRELRPRLLLNMDLTDDAIEILQQPWWEGLEDAKALQRIVSLGDLA